MINVINLLLFFNTHFHDILNCIKVNMLKYCMACEPRLVIIQF